MSGIVFGGDVEIIDAKLIAQGPNWKAQVTLKHSDAGWEHYADAWRIVSEDGEAIYGTRTLYHPHDTEQPFTRMLGGIQIPDAVTTVYVEAHDKKHGWAKKRLKVVLTK